MTDDDTLSLREWAGLFKRGFRITADELGYLWALALLPLYPYIAAVAMGITQPPKPHDAEKIQAAKERSADIDDWSELKSR